MKQKTRILIYILIGIAVMIIGTIVILAIPKSSKPISSQEDIELGRLYLLELSYDKAVLKFNEAIEIEPMNADAYLGLAEAYVGLDDTDSAIEALTEGYSRTNDVRIKIMLDELIPPEVEETAVATTSTETITTTSVTAETTTVTTEETTTISTIELVTIPNLSGLTMVEAVSFCESMGLGYEIRTSESDNIEKDHVISQSVPAGSNVPFNTVLHIDISLGKQKTTVIYAEDFLGMTYGEVFEILGEGRLSGWNGGMGYYWEELDLELTAYQNEINMNYGSSDSVDIPEDAHVGVVYTWSEKYPANKDLSPGMSLLDAVKKCGLTEDDIYTSEMNVGFYVDLDAGKYPYSISLSTNKEDNYNVPLTCIILRATDYYSRS